MEEAQRFDVMTNAALLSLGRYTFQTKEWSRLGKLLLGLRGISLRNYEGALHGMLQTIVTEVIETNN